MWDHSYLFLTHSLLFYQSTIYYQFFLFEIESFPLLLRSFSLLHACRNNITQEKEGTQVSYIHLELPVFEHITMCLLQEVSRKNLIKSLPSGMKSKNLYLLFCCFKGFIFSSFSIPVKTWRLFITNLEFIGPLISNFNALFWKVKAKGSL